MKQIINKKLYDTDTAERLNYWSNDLGASDFHFCYEGLYRKKNGELFLACKGGAASEYGEKRGSARYYGETIKPLTKAQAMEWAESRLSADEYMTIFGPVEE